jgi:hypothetical protein
MQRKTAVAAATAISMSLVSATIAIGANLGALGFAQSSPATVAQPNAVSAPAAPSAASRSGSTFREVGEHENENSTTGVAVTTTPGAGEKGHRSDD